MSRNWLREKSTWRADTPPSTCWSHSCGLLHSHPIKQDCQTVETASGPPTLPIKVTYKSCSFLFLLGYSAFLLLDSDTLSIWIQAKILTKNKCSVKKLVLMTELSTSEDAPPRWQPTNAEDCIFHQETCMMTHHRTILTKLSDLHMSLIYVPQHDTAFMKKICKSNMKLILNGFFTAYCNLLNKHQHTAHLKFTFTCVSHPGHMHPGSCFLATSLLPKHSSFSTSLPLSLHAGSTL